MVRARGAVEGMIDAGVPLEDVEFRIDRLSSLSRDEREHLLVWAWAWKESAARWEPRRPRVLARFIPAMGRRVPVAG